MILIPAQLEGHRSLKDRTLKITFETQELLPDQWAEIARNTQQLGFLAFQRDEFTTEQKKMLEGLKSDYNDPGKSPSKRLRNVLFVMWQQDPKGFETAEAHYNHYMEQIINFYKNKLD